MWRVAGIVVLLCATAVAQPGAAPVPQSTLVAPPSRERADRFMFAMGLLVGGGGPSNWLYGAYHAEGAVTILASPLRVRARAFGVLVGGTVESDWSGEFSRIGAGLEARLCTAELHTCLFGDLDVGYQSLALDDSDGSFVRSDKGAIVGPRAGVDWGRSVRLRFALEMYRFVGDHASDRGTSDGYRTFGTFALSVALGYQL